MFLDWPGLGHVPPRADVNGFEDMARLVLKSARPGPVDLIAQSMGGVGAMMAVLAGAGCVRLIVLAATSAGIDFTPAEFCGRRVLDL